MWVFDTFGPPLLIFPMVSNPIDDFMGMGARSQPRRAMEQCEVEESKLQDIRRVVDYLGKLTE